MAESMGLAIARHGVVVERARLDDATPLTVGQERSGGQAN
jgi:fumarate hydratase class II